MLTLIDLLGWATHCTISDVPEPWGLFFQDHSTPQMEGLEELHNNIMFYLAITLFALTWIILSIILNYRKAKISNKYVNHGILIELIWIITPALILIATLISSFFIIDMSVSNPIKIFILCMYLLVLFLLYEYFNKTKTVDITSCSFNPVEKSLSPIITLSTLTIYGSIMAIIFIFI